MKFCKDCIYFIPRHGGSPFGPWCKGPHIKQNIIYGHRSMELPSARCSGGVNLDPSFEPCGEVEARHFIQKPVKPSLWTRIFG